MKLTLASASPRRSALLSTLVDSFDCIATDIDETPRADESPATYVVRMAKEKIRAAKVDDGAVMGADTVVVLGEVILQKPVSATEARGMLRALSGRTHVVMTALAFLCAGETQTVLIETQVEFAVLGDSLIEQYLLTDEPWDKAGAYGIQGRGGAFVKRIEGSYSAVVGLPLCETRNLLEGAGIAVFESHVDA